MHGLMMDSPLLITEIMRFADTQLPGREIVSVTLDNPRHRTHAAARSSAAPASSPMRCRPRASSRATASRRSPGTTTVTSSCTTPSRAWARCCTPSIRGSFPEQLEFIVNHAEDKLLFVDPTLLPVLAPLAGQDRRRSRRSSSRPRRLHASRGRRQAAGLRIVHRRAAGAVRLAGARRTHGEFALLHVGHDRQPEGRALQPPLDGAARLRRLHGRRDGPERPRLVLAVVPMFHANAWGLPYNAPMTGAKLVFPGPKMGDAATLTQLHERGRRDARRRRADRLDDAAQLPATRRGTEAARR